MAGLRNPISSPTRKNAVIQLPPSLGSSLVTIWRRLVLSLSQKAHQVEAVEVRLQRALQAVFGVEHGVFHDRVGGGAEGPAADTVVAGYPRRHDGRKHRQAPSRPARPAAVRRTGSGTPARAMISQPNAYRVSPPAPTSAPVRPASTRTPYWPHFGARASCSSRTTHQTSPRKQDQQQHRGQPRHAEPPEQLRAQQQAGRQPGHPGIKQAPGQKKHQRDGRERTRTD